MFSPSSSAGSNIGNTEICRDDISSHFDMLCECTTQEEEGGCLSADR